MNLFGLNISLPRLAASKRSVDGPLETPISTLSSEAQAWIRGEDIPPSRSPALANAYEQVVWVYRAVNAVAEQIANIPFLFSRGERGRESLISSGPLIDFYSRPHPNINAFQYWELRVLWLLLRGECIRIPIFEDSTGVEHLASNSIPGRSSLRPSIPSYWAGINAEGPRNTHHGTRSNSKLKSILLLDPARFHHVIENHQLIGWRYNDSPSAPLDSQVFLPEEVWFDRLPNPFDFWRGLSPLQVASLAARTDFAAASFMFGLLDNNADAGVIVRSDQQLSDEQQEQICATLRNRRCRSGALNRSMFLWGANEIITPRLSSADLQFLENRKLSRAEICSAFGVPEEIVTTTDHNKYDVMQGARLNFIENRIAPLCARLEAEELQTVRSIDPTAIGWFDLDALPIMQQARRDRLAAAKTGFDMGIPFNELNRVLDLGFKPLPWGNIGYLPSKYQPLQSSSSSSSSSISSLSGATRPSPTNPNHNSF
jgi:phage portal protein BeeE